MLRKKEGRWGKGEGKEGRERERRKEKQKCVFGDDCPVVRTLVFIAEGTGSIPAQGTGIPQAWILSLPSPQSIPLRESKGGDFPGGSEGKAYACNVGNPGSIPGSGRSPGEGNGNPLQYSCLENPMD